MLADNLHIVQKTTNLGTLAELKITVYGLVFKYKLSKYDAIGAIEGKDTTVALSAIKSMLWYGIHAFLSFKGYNSADMVEYALLKLLSDVDKDGEVYSVCKRIIYSNENNLESIKHYFDECITLVEHKFIPQDIWNVMGNDDLVNWKNWIYLIVELTKMMDFVGWTNREIAPENSHEEWMKWKMITEQVFGS